MCSRSFRRRPSPGGTWDGCLASCRPLAGGRRRGLGGRLDADALLRLRLMLAADPSVGGGEDRVVATETRPGPGEEGHAALADDDGAGGDQLAVTGLDAQPLAD